MNESQTDVLESKESNRIDRKISRDGSINSKLVSERSRTLKWAIQQYTPIQIWDWLFKACEVNGRTLLEEGLIDVKDIEECIVKGLCNKLGITLPAWSILKCLLASAKSDSFGLVIYDETELTRTNWPRDKVFQWFMGPLFVMKEQIKGLNLMEDEEMCLKRLIMQSNNDMPEDWDDRSFPSDDKIRRAQLQAIIRRLQGIVGSMSRMPTFRRRYRNLVKVLCVEAIQNGILRSEVGEIIITRNGVKKSAEKGEHETGAGDIV